MNQTSSVGLNVNGKSSFFLPETVHNVALEQQHSRRPLRTPRRPSLLVVMETLNIDAAIIQGHVDTPLRL